MFVAGLSVCYCLERFSLRFFLFSALSFLVIGFFFEPFPIPNYNRHTKVVEVENEAFGSNNTKK